MTSGTASSGDAKISDGSNASEKKSGKRTKTLESLSVSSSSSVSESESKPTSVIPATNTSSLPPRPPPKPPKAPESQVASIDTIKGSNEKQLSNLDGISDQTVPITQAVGGNLPMPRNEKPPRLTRDLRGTSFGTENNSKANDERIHIGQNTEQNQKTPSKNAHRRKVSWGGKQITIPNINTDNLTASPLPEKIIDHFLEGNAVVASGEYENQRALRAKAASELVSSIEAAMPDESAVTSMIMNGKPFNHHRNESSASVINVTDLANLHPIESEAKYEIMKAIETQEVGQPEQVEAVASLFSTSEPTLLENVPEGAEGIFSSGRKMSLDASVAGGSTLTPMSETMVGSGTYKSYTDTIGGSTLQKRDADTTVRNLETSPRSRRSRAFSTDTRASGVRQRSHQRTNTIFTDRTITSTMRSPPRQNQTRKFEYGPKRHRRQETMEERLFLLNQALNAADNQASPERSDVEVGDKERTKWEPERPAHHAPSTSLDLFNQNLARLFQGIDMNPVRGENDFGEEEAMPLTENEATPLSQPEVQNNSTSSSHSCSEDVKDEAVAMGKSFEIEQNSTPIKTLYQVEDDAELTFSESQKKKFEFENIDGDVEAGDFPPLTPTTKSEKKSSLSSNDKKKSSLFRSWLSGIGLVKDMRFFLRSRSSSILRYLKNLAWLILVVTVAAMVLFYALGNPPIEYIDVTEPHSQNSTCRYYPNQKDIADQDNAEASYSWWVLYLLLRLPITFTVAWGLEIFLVEFIILECRWVASCIGSTFTLLVVQAKGWPAILFFWSILNLIMLYGKSPFVSHWGYWQDLIELFNECNPSGNIISSDFNLRVHLIALAVSIIVAIKRLLIGFHQGRKTFLHYAGELSSVMTKILLISEVANLAMELEFEDEDEDDLSDPDDDSYMKDKNFLLKSLSKTKRVGVRRKQASIADIAGIETVARGFLDSAMETDTDVNRNKDKIDGENSQGDEPAWDPSLKTSNSMKTGATKNKLLISDQDKEFVTGLLSQSQQRRIEQLLGNWEEPEKEKILANSVSIGAILQFRNSLSRLDSRYPFSYAFGDSDRRDHCIESSQNLYLRLVEKSPDTILHFNILGLVALQRDGLLDQEKLKSLIQVFRPDRNGRLSLIDFVKSVDIVYKEMKLLRASVRSSQKIDKSFEKIFNIFFYFVIACVILTILGQDPIALFVSLSSVVLSFSFMISQASSKYVEGLLFILYRRPYDIGDYIMIQPVEENTSLNGSAEWIVRDINLFTTTVIYAYTNEVATLSNGSIANSRVMNGARSLPAILYIKLRFGVDTSFEKLDIFREALSQYIDNRPREWVKLLDIKNVNVQSDQGYVEYLVSIQHVNNWQETDTLRKSRSHAQSFCHELSKQLDIRYKSPSLPVDLFVQESTSNVPNEDDNIVDMSMVPSMPRMSAQSEQIRSLIGDHRI